MTKCPLIAETSNIIIVVHNASLREAWGYLTRRIGAILLTTANYTPPLFGPKGPFVFSSSAAPSSHTILHHFRSTLTPALVLPRIRYRTNELAHDRTRHSLCDQYWMLHAEPLEGQESEY